MAFGIEEAKLHFKLNNSIGANEGKNSEVFLAHDIQLDAPICVKKIRKTEFENPKGYFDEAKKLYLSTHNNVVPVQYSCQDDDHIYIAMPYYKEGSLNKLIDQRFLTVREIVRYAIQFLGGLNQIHIKGLIHFDIKPTNILISDNNEAMIADFGISQHTNTWGLSKCDLSYTRHFPPERFSANAFSLHHDIYHVGLTLYRMCNGNQNFISQYENCCLIDGKYNRDFYIKNITKGIFPDRKFYLPHIPKKLKTIINKALAIDPNDRFANCLEIINDLNKIEDAPNVDWEYSPDQHGGCWLQHQEDRVLEVKLNGHSITSKKTMKGTGREYKNNHSDSSVNTPEKALKALQNVLKSYEG